MLRVAPKFQSLGWAEHWLVGWFLVIFSTFFSTFKNFFQLFEGGAKIPILGMGGALVGWWWAHIEECGDGPGRRHSDTQLESVPLYCHQHTSAATFRPS